MKDMDWIGAEIEALKYALSTIDEKIAAIWADGPPPKDGSFILGIFDGFPIVVQWGATDPYWGEVDPCHECAWVMRYGSYGVIKREDPEKWARITIPDKKT